MNFTLIILIAAHPALAMIAAGLTAMILASRS